MKNTSKNRERAKLLLAELEAELELLESEELNSCKAGYGGPVPNFPTGYFFAGGTGGFFHDNSNSNGGGSDWDTVPGNGSEEDPYQLQEVEVGGSSSSNPSYGGGSFYGGNSFYEGGSFSNGGGGGESSSFPSYGGVTPRTDCFFQCLGHISSKYGYHYDSSYYENQYYSNYGGRGMGIDPSYIDHFTSNYFSRSYLNLHSLNTMENFVANPNNSLIVIYNVGMGSDGVFEQHAVVVERIFEGGGMLCFDPQLKTRIAITKGQIVGYLAITGNCN